MDYQLSPFLIGLACLCLYFFFSRKRRSTKLPPGPKPWPVFGNIFQLSKSPHVSLTNLSKIHGPLMTLELGSVTTVVVSSADVAREVFQKHDLELSSRKIVEASHTMDHHKHSMVWLPVSPKWRNLRKIAAIHLFTQRQLDATELLRNKKQQELLEHVRECCRKGRPVEIGEAAFTTSLNLLSTTFFSTDLAGHSSASAHEFKDFIWAMMEVGGKPNLADFFPVLGHFDLLGIRRSTEFYMSKFFTIFDDIIQQRLSADPSSSSSDKDDVLETLLRINKQDGSDLSLDDIKHLLIDLFTAGTDTTSNTFEWAMTELLRNPVKMAKAQAELDEILGCKEGVVQESDIARLPYLQAIVKETFRLHPPAPLLIPHKAEKDVVLCGYTVPRNSQILVNVWAIGRDPSTWPNPLTFIPERFMDSEMDFKGQHFELLPFGSGRRMCPALPLAYRMLHLTLAKFLYYFDWKLEDGMRGEDVDMTEKFGMTLQKATPLLAIAVARK